MKDLSKTCLSVAVIILFSFRGTLLGQCGAYPTSGTTSIGSANTIINSYYPGTGSPAAGTFILTLGTLNANGNTSVLTAGDLVVIMQMQGADINTTNTDAYGDGVVGGTASGYLTSNLYAGNYEYNTVASLAGSTLTLSYALANNYYTQNYSATTGKRGYQVIKVPKYYNATIAASSSITAPAWNGGSGGVVVIDAANVFTFSAASSTVNVAGKGFRGGGGKNFGGATAGNSSGSAALTNTDYRFPSAVSNTSNLTGGTKGEGIAGTPIYIPNPTTTLTDASALEGYIGGAMGWGAPANAGGGGTDGAPVGSVQNQYNTGGGGGANKGAGGKGGSGWDGGTGNAATYNTGGWGGAAFTQTKLSSVIMGGGGGAGSANNSTTANEFNASGASGGGIIIIRAKSYAGNGSLIADGAAPVDMTVAGQTDAAGGGGAGGTIIVVTTAAGTSGLAGVTASAVGGRGANMAIYYSHGPGGGGGGGIIYSTGALASAAVNGGAAGFTHTCCAVGNPLTDNYNATAGSAGSVVTIASFSTLTNPGNPASPCGLLPILVTGFAAQVSNHSIVNLSWKAEAAIDFNSFIIQYSKDGIHFDEAGKMAFSAVADSYHFSHEPSGSQFFYYRLKLLNNDCSFSYSNTLVVRLQTNETFNIFPNPANTNCTLEMLSAANQTGQLHLYDNSGRLILQKNLSLVKGSNFIALPEIAGLMKGVYQVTVALDSKSYSKTLLKH